MRHSLLVIPAVLLVPLTSCGSGGSDAVSTDAGNSAAHAWCGRALPISSLAGAGIKAAAASVGVRVGEPGKPSSGIECGFRNSDFGYVTVARVVMRDAEAAEEFVGQPDDSSRSLDGFDTFDAGFVGGSDSSEYRMIAQKGATVVVGRASACPEEEQCDEAFAALLATTSSTPAPKRGDDCVGPDGDKYQVLPLVADEPDESFALVQGDDVAWVVTDNGIDTNVLRVMKGHRVNEAEVEKNSAGQVVSVESVPVLTNGAALESVGYVLEKDWAIVLDDDHAAVTTYKGDASAPFVDGRFLVSEGQACIPVDSIR